MEAVAVSKCATGTGLCAPFLLRTLGLHRDFGPGDAGDGENRVGGVLLRRKGGGTCRARVKRGVVTLETYAKKFQLIIFGSSAPCFLEVQS